MNPQLSKPQVAAPQPLKEQPDPLHCGRCESEQDSLDHEVEGRSVCDDCHDHSWNCYRCKSRFFDGTDYIRYGDDRLCDGCYDADYFTCEGCCNVLHNDDYDTDSLCTDCSGPNDEESDEDAIEPYLRAYEGVWRGNTRGPFPTLYLTGLELECEGGTPEDLRDELPKEVGISRDGSLEDGAELVTPPASGNELQRLLDASCKAARTAGYDVSDRCGLHVHVEYPKNDVLVRQLFETTYAIEDVLLAIQPDSRLRNHYCQSIRQDYTFRSRRVSPRSFKEKWYADRVDPGKYNDTRYHGVNLHSVWLRGTVEFRYHAGTLAPDKVTAWIRICQSIANYARNRYDEADVQRVLHAKGTPATRAVEVAELLRWEPDLFEYVVGRIRNFGEHRVFWDATAQPAMEQALCKLLGKETNHERRALREESALAGQLLEDGEYAQAFGQLLEVTA